jgi:hypothetical protein
MLKPKVKIIADSINPLGNRLTTFQISFPVVILAEIGTHRALSKNAGSSRAKPFKVLRRELNEQSFEPSTWLANQGGMQGYTELSPIRKFFAKLVWRSHKNFSILSHYLLGDVIGLHKQYTNRVLATHAYADVVVSATEWKNFFMLRCHKDAQPEFQKIAFAMKKAYDLNSPKFLNAGEWHLPYILDEELSLFDRAELQQMSIARCARVSYKAFDGSANFQKDLELCDKLFGSQPMHLSPTEHVAMSLNSHERSGNFCGFKQFRKSILDESGGDYSES